MSRLDTLARRSASELHSEVESMEVPPLDLNRIREHQSRRTIRASLIAVAAVAVVVGVPIWLGNLAPEEPVGPNITVPPAGDPSLYLGTWVTTEIQAWGKAATMDIEESEADSVQVTMRNRFWVCPDGPSTMTGAGRLQDGPSLVIPAPMLTCDDGGQPEPGSLQQFQKLTVTRDPTTDILTDNFAGVWVREGAEDKDAESTTPHSETEINELLNAFVNSRVAGEAAQQYLNGPAGEIPLLYMTSSGARYALGEFEQMSGIAGPYGEIVFRVRLVAGDTVVEQIFTLAPAGRLGLGYPGSFGTGGDLAPTTEDGQPVPESQDIFDGAVTLHIAHPWVVSGDRLVLVPVGVGPTTDGGERNSWVTVVPVVDPKFGVGCETHPEPADAAALAESIRSWPGLETTAPVAVGGGGLMMDVVVGDPATASCRSFGGPILGQGRRMRLYLFDAPQGMSMRILAIPIIVPESDFERAVEATVPITVDFHTP